MSNKLSLYINKSIEEHFQLLHFYPNLLNPQTFNEKIIWLKLKTSSKYTNLVDKLRSRTIVKEMVGEKYLVPLVGVFHSYKDLENALEKFPEKFVIKANHGSGWVIICENTSNFKLVNHVQEINDWLQTDYSSIHGELIYQNISKSIIVEDLLEDAKGEADDYKFECFQGKAKYVQIFKNRFSGLKSIVMDVNWKKTDFNFGHPMINETLELPKNFSKMIKIAETLSAGFDYLRVDLYNIDGKIYFGEFTPTPSAGYRKHFPLEANYYFGQLLKNNNVFPVKKIGVIYTCVTNNYDLLHNHTFSHPLFDYVCFTDDLSIASDNNSNWQFRPLQFSKLDKTRNQRWHKLHPHLLFPDYDYSIYVDSNVDVKSHQFFNDVTTAIESKKAISVSIHPSRDCLFEEYEACVKLKKDQVSVMNKQIELIEKSGFPKNYGLFETNIMLRKHHDKKAILLMREWWKMIKNFSFRDQLSLTYLAWKMKIKIWPLHPVSYRDQKEVVFIYPHLHEMRENISELNFRIDDLISENDELKKQLRTIHNSKTYKIWQQLVKLKGKFNK